MYDRVHLGYADTIIVPAAPSIFTIRSSAYRRPTPEEYERTLARTAFARLDPSDSGTPGDSGERYLNQRFRNEEKGSEAEVPRSP